MEKFIEKLHGKINTAASTEDVAGRRILPDKYYRLFMELIEDAKLECDG